VRRCGGFFGSFVGGGVGGGTGGGATTSSVVGGGVGGVGGSGGGGFGGFSVGLATAAGDSFVRVMTNTTTATASTASSATASTRPRCERRIGGSAMRRSEGRSGSGVGRRTCSVRSPGIAGEMISAGAASSIASAAIGATSVPGAGVGVENAAMIGTPPGTGDSRRPPGARSEPGGGAGVIGVADGVVRRVGGGGAIAIGFGSVIGLVGGLAIGFGSVIGLEIGLGLDDGDGRGGAMRPPEPASRSISIGARCTPTCVVVVVLVFVTSAGGSAGCIRSVASRSVTPVGSSSCAIGASSFDCMPVVGARLSSSACTTCASTKNAPCLRAFTQSSRRPGYSESIKRASAAGRIESCAVAA